MSAFSALHHGCYAALGQVHLATQHGGPGTRASQGERERETTAHAGLAFSQFDDNHGPLVRLNKIGNIVGQPRGKYLHRPTT